MNQEEKVDETGWTEPAGFNLIPYPFADDLRAAPIEQAARGTYSCHSPIQMLMSPADGSPTASADVVEAAKAWIAKLQIKNGGYPPDANPNPGALMLPGTIFANILFLTELVQRSHTITRNWRPARSARSMIANRLKIRRGRNLI